MNKSSDIVSEDVYHKPLEGRWCITIALLHNIADESAIYGGKHCLHDI